MTGRVIPLSPQQRQIWRQQRQSGAQPFRTRGTVVVEGALDPERLRAALEDRAARHEILRSTFRQDPGGEVVAEVASAPGQLVWRFAEAAAGEAGILHLEPALKAGLERLGPYRHLLRLDLPTPWADHSGLESLVREVALAYEALACGAATPEVPVQYGVLARWQNEILETEEARLGRNFWSRQDLTSLVVSRLPWERATRAGQPFAPGSIPVPGSHELLGGLAAAGLDASPAELLQACWQVLLWRLVGGPEIVLGTAFSGRVYDEVEHAVGPFAKDLPIRLRLTEGTPFASAVRRLCEALDEAREWQEYFTWDHLQRVLGDGGSLFFPFAFEHRALPPPFAAGGLRFRFTAVESCHDRFRVKLRSCDSSGSSSLEILYDSGVLVVSDVERMAEQLATLAAAAAADPSRAVGDLPLVGPAERHQIIAELAGAPGPPPRRQALQAGFEEQAARGPERTAVIAGECEFTYAELNAGANQLARHLCALGVAEGDLVGAFLARSAAMPMVILAILKAGAAYLPLDPAYPTDRLDFMIRDSRVRWILVEGELPASLPQNGAELIFLDREAQAVARQPREDLGLEVAPGSPAYVMYTSGSTGGPRGVVISHGCVAHYVDALQSRLGLEPGDRYLHTASVAFSSSVRQLLVPLSHGAAVVVASAEQRIDPAALFREVRDRGATVIDLVPSHWRGCHRVFEAMDPAARRALLANRLRLALSASEPLLSDLPAAWSAAFGSRVRLINMYGQTETTGIVSTYPIPPDPDGVHGVVPIGRPLPGTALYLLDERGELAPIGAAGELCVAGPAVGQGYLGLPAETAERLVPDPFGGAPGGRLYRTGDLGRLRSDGMIEFLGRRDQQVKVRGFRVEPGEVEVALGRHEAVREAAVVLHRNEPSGAERLVAFVVPGGEPLPPSEELRSFLRRTLPEHMIPASFVPLEALPLTPNGKLDRRALPAPTREADTAYVAPRDPVEHQLADIWQEMLGLGRVGVLENFFSLGGHSLLASMVVSRVRDTFQVELPVLALFRSPTVAGLALEVREAREAVRAVPNLGRIVRVQAEEEQQRLLTDLDGMSDEQVSALLAQLLAREAEE